MKENVDLTDAVWKKAKKSGAAGECVEAAIVPGHVAVRDSKDPTGKTLIFTVAEWDAFLDGARNGEFDVDQ